MLHGLVSKVVPEDKVEEEVGVVYIEVGVVYIEVGMVNIEVGMIYKEVGMIYIESKVFCIGEDVVLFDSMWFT